MEFTCLSVELIDVIIQNN